MAIVKKITIKYERCTGCRICEIICSLTRSGRVGHSFSRVNVHSFPPGLDIPILCVHCDRALCLESCPANAIEKNKYGLVEIVDSKCTGCGACVNACPAHAIKIHPERGFAFKCDLCGGEPVCVALCPNHAIDFSNVPFDTRVYAKRAEEIASNLRKLVFGREG